MKTKLQQNVRLFVRPPAGLSVPLSILFEMDYKKTAQQWMFFYQKQVRDSQRVLVRTLAYAPFNLEPLSSQKPHYSFRHLEKSLAAVLGKGTYLADHSAIV